MIDGVFRHQDANGGGGLITDGDTHLMTAGAVPGQGRAKSPPTQTIEHQFEN